MNEVEKDITNLHRKLLRKVIDYLTNWEPGLRGPVSNTQLRKWGWYHYKRRKMEGYF